MDSVEYYNKHAEAFCARTLHVDMQEVYQKFLRYLPKEARILDAGCGVGRDSRFFLNQGHKVLALDASLEMVRLASQVAGQEVLHMRFEEMPFQHAFDAVWANASLLHVPYASLKEIVRIFHKALVPSGIFYASFKYGSSMRQAGERFFSDMNEAMLVPYLEGFFELLDVWQSADQRSETLSPERSWLHFVARRF